VLVVYQSGPTRVNAIRLTRPRRHYWLARPRRTDVRHASMTVTQRRRVRTISRCRSYARRPHSTCRATLEGISSSTSSSTPLHFGGWTPEPLVSLLRRASRLNRSTMTWPFDVDVRNAAPRIRATLPTVGASHSWWAVVGPLRSGGRELGDPSGVHRGRIEVSKIDVAATTAPRSEGSNTSVSTLGGPSTPSRFGRDRLTIVTTSVSTHATWGIPLSWIRNPKSTPRWSSYWFVS